VKPKKPFTEKMYLNAYKETFIEVNNQFCSLKDPKLLCCLQSLLNEKINFSSGLVQIKLQFFSPPTFTDPLKFIHVRSRVHGDP